MVDLDFSSVSTFKVTAVKEKKKTLFYNLLNQHIFIPNLSNSAAWSVAFSFKLQGASHLPCSMVMFTLICYKQHLVRFSKLKGPMVKLAMTPNIQHPIRLSMLLLLFKCCEAAFQ